MENEQLEKNWPCDPERSQKDDPILWSKNVLITRYRRGLDIYRTTSFEVLLFTEVSEMGWVLRRWLTDFLGDLPKSYRWKVPWVRARQRHLNRRKHGDWERKLNREKEVATKSWWVCKYYVSNYKQLSSVNSAFIVRRDNQAFWHLWIDFWTD